MRLTLLIFILLIPLAAATDYTFYQNGNQTIDGVNYTFSLNLGSNADFDQAIATYENAIKAQSDDGTLSTLRSMAEDALARAKADDKVIIHYGTETTILNYQECTILNNNNLCFTSSTYYEEEAPPLGDGQLSSVKVNNGTILLPFVISIDPLTSSMSTSRSITKNPLYPGETAIVSALAQNTGNVDLAQVKISEYPELPTNDKTEIYDAQVKPNQILALSYTITAQAPGVYKLSGIASAVNQSVPIADTFVTVLDPINSTIVITPGYTGEPTQFTITLDNEYSQPLSVKSLRLSTSGVFSGISSPTPFFLQGGDKVSSGFTLDSEINITGNVTLADGVTTITLISSYTTGDDVTRMQKISASTEASPRVFSASVEYSKTGVLLNLSNTKKETIPTISIDWGDGKTQTINNFKAENSMEIRHGYDTLEPIVVSADKILTFNPPNDTENLPEVPFNSSSQVNTPQTTPTTSENQPESAPQTTDTPQTTDDKPKKSIIQSFLDFLSNLFG